MKRREITKRAWREAEKKEKEQKTRKGEKTLVGERKKLSFLKIV